MQKPKYKKGDRCMFVQLVDNRPSIMDDNMVINTDMPTWLKGEWWYDVKGRSVPCAESALSAYVPLDQRQSVAQN